MNLIEYKTLIRNRLLATFPDISIQMGATDFDKLVTGITRQPVKWLLNELDNRLGEGERYDVVVADLRAEFEIDE